MSTLFASPSLLAQSAIAENLEPNDSMSTATPLPCGNQGEGNLGGGGGDRDWWAVTLSQAADLSAWTTSRGATLGFGGTSVDDTVLTLYDTDGVTVIAQNDNNQERPFAQRGFFSTLRAGSLAPGTYFLEVTGWSLLGEGDYGLDVDCTSPPLGFCGPSAAGPAEVEPNDVHTDGGVATIPGCELVTGSITVANDEDYWGFTLTGPTRLVIDARADSGSGTPIFDSQLWLYGSDGVTELAFDDDSGFQFLARIQVDLGAGDYFVRVRSFHVLTGDYELAIDRAPLPSGIPVLADVIVDTSSAGCLGTLSQPMTIVARRNEWPKLGSRFVFDIAGAVTPPVVLYSNIPQIPIDLAVIGAPGCVFALQPLGSLPATPTVLGEYQFALSISTDPNQIGVNFFCQTAAIDLGANALGVTLSDRIVMSIGADG